MPVKKGRLKPENDCKIRMNYKFLMDDFDPDNGTLDHMISALVFDNHDRDVVKNGGPNTAQGRVERFISILENAGQDAYQHFIEALKQSGEDHIAQRLEETVVPDSEKSDPQAWIDELPESVKNQRPSDPDTSRLSGVFGKGWQHVFTELEVTSAKIQQAEMNSPHSVSVAIVSLLSRWRQSKGTNALFIHLLDAMRRASNRCTIDWEAVEKVVRDKMESD